MGFNEKVWELCKEVPKGKLTTYGKIAKVLGGKGYRAVGNALNKNRDSTVPCHRVVKSNGSIGGFVHGSKKKIEMLKREGIEIKKGKVVDFKKKLYSY